MGISIRAYARARGVSDTAVRKAIKVGRITPEPDGTIDPVKADTQWTSNTDPALQRKPQADELPAKTAAPDSKVSPAASRQPSTPAPRLVGPPAVAVSTPMNTGVTSLLQARTANEVLKAQTNKVRLARMKGELVERSQAVAHVFKLARAERDAWLNWPARVSAQMAAGLGIESHAVHLVLEAAVREHLVELGEVAIRID